MRVFLDTNIILNDFFNRHPDFGFQRINNPEQAKDVEQYRQLVSESLLFISIQKDVEVYTSSSILARFASVLGDLLVPPDLVLEEMNHWLSNLKLSDLKVSDLMEAIEKMEVSDPKLDFDDYLIKHLAVIYSIDVVLTSIPKSKEFYWPVLIFKPENIRTLFKA